MKPYKVKHVPTGLYYMPSSATNLTKRGKIYNGGGSILTYTNDDSIRLRLLRNSPAYKEHKEYFDNYEFNRSNYYGKSWSILLDIPKKDFIKEEL